MGCAILVQNALVRHPVDLGDHGGKGGFRGFLVTGGDGLENALDRGAHAGSQCHVVRAALDGLPGAFLC